eukprot:m.24352 g.24352  ORF g.24352 m.24352 type:complete len:271 (+) comp14570_c0_seq1:123-935(+)
MPKSFECVFIPHDINAAVEQRTVTYNEKTEVSCLTDYCKQHFSANHGNRSADQNDVFMKSVLAQAKEKNPSLDISTVDPKMLSQFGNMQMVDVVSLITPAKPHGFVTVGLYCDDSGTFKNLPTNVRAFQLTQYCGRPTNVLGDAFISRMKDDGNDVFARLDFTMDEFSPGAAWIKMAAEINAKKAADEADSVAKDKAKAKVVVKKKPPTTAATIATWRKQMDKWAEDKLKEWDTDEAFRKQRQEKHATREEYQIWLQQKSDDKIKKQTVK